MSQTSAGTSGLVRVTVAAGTRRVDLAVPGALPVAELVPELARGVGLLDPGTVHAGHRLVTADGRALVGDTGLRDQGIEDGALLVVAAGDLAPARVYDDVVEAMADVVERDRRPWDLASGRRAALGAAGLLLALGATALLLQRGSGPDRLGASAAALVALGLAAGAVLLPRPEAAAAVAWLGAGYGAVAGLLAAPEGRFLGQPVAYAGGGALFVGLIALVGLGGGRTRVLPPVVVGAVFGAAGLVLPAVPLDPAVVLTSALVLVVLAGSAVPRLALGVTGTDVERLSSTAETRGVAGEPDAIDLASVGADARLAHEVLLAAAATTGLLLVLLAPLAVSLGVSGTLLAAAACLVVMLRTRRHRGAAEVLAGLVSGVLGLGSVAVATLGLHPDWRPVVAVALAGAGAVLLAVTLAESPPSVRRGWWGDLAESLALLSLLPLLVLATGVFAAVRG